MTASTIETRTTEAGAIEKPWEARRWCSGDGAWTRWQPCTEQQKSEWSTREDFEFRPARNVKS